MMMMTMMMMTTTRTSMMTSNMRAILPKFQIFNQNKYCNSLIVLLNHRKIFRGVYFVEATLFLIGGTVHGRDALIPVQVRERASSSSGCLNSSPAPGLAHGVKYS